MLSIVSFLIGGIVLGYIFRSVKFRHFNYITMLIIYILLFTLGIEVGSNKLISANFSAITLKAFAVASLSILGSAIAAKILWNKKS